MAAPFGNTYNKKYTEDEAKKAFMEMLEATKEDDDCLCLQEVYVNYNMPSSTFHHLINTFKDLERIKKDINDILIIRINKGSLKGTYPATPAIWREKQLGEKDKQEINHSGNGLSITVQTDKK